MVDESKSKLSENINEQDDFSLERISTLSLQLKDKMKGAIYEIEKINHKSHILGLNAKVVSARAGEAGKAFSIVSSEMMVLSKGIDDLIKRLQSETSNDFDEIAAINSFIATSFRGTRLSDMALTNIDLIDRNLYERSCDVRWWATDSSLVLALTENTPDAFEFASSRMKAILDSYTVYFDLVLCDMDGKVVADGSDGRYDSIGQDVSDCAWFCSAMACKSGDDYVWETVHRSPLVNDELVLVYSTAVRADGKPNGKIIGVLGVIFRYESLAQTIVKNVHLSKEEKEKSRVCIVDDKGLVLADSDNKCLSDTIDFEAKEELFKNKKGFVIDNYDNAKCCIAHALAPGYESYSTNWHSLIIQKL